VSPFFPTSVEIVFKNRNIVKKTKLRAGSAKSCTRTDAPVGRCGSILARNLSEKKKELFLKIQILRNKIHFIGQNFLPATMTQDKSTAVIHRFPCYNIARVEQNMSLGALQTRQPYMCHGFRIQMH